MTTRRGPDTGRIRRRQGAKAKATTGRRRPQPKRSRGWLTRRRWVALATVLGIVSVTVLWLIWPYWRLSGQFADEPRRQPSRLYESPRWLEVGAPLGPSRLISWLEERGYRSGGDGESGSHPIPSGEYRAGSDRLLVGLRAAPTAAGWQPAGQLEVRFERGAIAAIHLDDEELSRCAIEPRLLTSYYGPLLRDRWPERVDEMPEHVLRAVLAAEDSAFYRHPGLSPSGIVRAFWVNLRDQEVSQGGSTLTQQLVKNLYLTHERSVVRKLREAAIAVLIELRRSKDEILQAYLNEIYMGRSGSVHLMGFGAASRAYFGRPAIELTVAQAATLAGLIRSPANLSPRADRDASKRRRDVVLRRMAELDWLTPAQLEEALDEELSIVERGIDLRTARYAADAAEAEVERRFGITALDDAGFLLVSTLDADDQRAAEASVAWGVVALEEGWQKGAASDLPLQSALLSIDPRDGGVLAWVGGRDYGASQFDRVRFAKRQPGSAFKPIVLSAAFAERAATPGTLLADEPLTVVQAGNRWSPQNDDREYHGVVTVRETMERSLNVPTVRLALHVGLPKIVAWARQLGITGRLQRVPSIALGSFETTPLELLGVYSVFAAGGRAPEIHLLQGILDRSGEPIEGTAVSPPRQLLEPGVAYLVTSVLEGVVDRGSGRQLRRDGLSDVLAGKTGTSNERRDSWFIGYSPERATLVWVGYDDARTTRLSGTRAALPIWGRFTAKRRPASGYSVPLPPEDVQTATIDPASGQLATGRCPEVRTEVFLRDAVPWDRCELHDGGRRGRRGRDRDRPWWKFWDRGRE